MAPETAGAETSVNRSLIQTELTVRGVPKQLSATAVLGLPDTALGLLLYGSYARGDATSESDLDLLVLSRRRLVPPEHPGLSVNSYSPDELKEAAGSLFAYHLRRDGIPLHGAPALRDAMAGAIAPRPEELLRRIRSLSSVLDVEDDAAANRVAGLVRVAKYLLRSALYAQAIGGGDPSFSLQELAERAAEPRIAILLSSHVDVSPTPSAAILGELKRRLAAVVGECPDAPGDTLEAVAINAWESDRDLARLAVLALGEDGVDVPYDLLGRVIL